MITLYVKPGCQYCERTLAAAAELGVPLEKKNIYDIGVAEELVRLGGMRQMPYMMDSEKGVSMYESEDIINYFHTLK